MQVQAISYNSNNKTGFNALYKPYGAKFSPLQTEVFESMTRVLNEKSSRFNGESAMDFFKSKKIDFIVKSDHDDSLYLSGLMNVKDVGIGADKGITYTSEFGIGRYDKENPLNVKDIDAQLNEFHKNNIWAIVLFSLCGAVIFTCFIGGNIIRKNSSQKPLIENIDSAAKQIKTILPDTTKVFKSFK